MVSTAFNINGFLSQVANKGLVRTNKFQCWFNLPNGFNGGTGVLSSSVGSVNLSNLSPLQYARDFVAWCSSVTLPDIAIQTQELQRYSLGPVTNVARVPKFSPCQLSIIADANGDTRNFFESWMQLVGEYSFNSIGARNPAPSNYTPFSLGYPDDYVTQLYVSTFDDAGNEISRHCFDRAFPTVLGAVKLDWDMNNEILHFPVEFRFDYWYQVPTTP